MYATARSLLKSKSRCFTNRHISVFLQQNVQPSDKTHAFLSAFPEVVDSTIRSTFFENFPLMAQHFTEVLQYNVLKEKRFRPAILLDAYRTLEEPYKLTDDNLHLANILAWAFELYQTSYIMNDDIMDGSQMRGNEPSWFLKEKVGLNAVNDAIFVMEASFILLEKYFSQSDEYQLLQTLFRHMNISSAIGQGMDWKCNSNQKPNYDTFTTETYNFIVRNKSCVPFVEAPFTGGLILSNQCNNKTLNEITDVLIKLGQLFQIDNDVLDIFDNGEVRNMIGSDIKEGKCSWLAVNVLESGRSDLIQIFKDNYSKQQPENEYKVIDVYLKLNLYDKYIEHKNETFEFVNQRITKISNPLLQQAILNLAENIVV